MGGKPSPGGACSEGGIPICSLQNWDIHYCVQKKVHPALHIIYMTLGYRPPVYPGKRSRRTV